MALGRGMSSARASGRVVGRLLACLVTAGSLVAGGLALPAAAVASPVPAAAARSASMAGSGPIGGPELGSTGVVVHRMAGAPRLPRHLTGSAWLVADLDTGQVLAARDPHGKFLPASTLKILTAVTLLPRLDPAKWVKTSDAAASVDGTRVGLVPRFHYRVRELFEAMLVMSANDAAVALAEKYGGVRRTAAAMNAEARLLNADDTTAKTPNGLDAPGQVTSAYDLALIARAGLARADFRHYIGIVHANFPAPRHKHYQIWTHDELLTNYRGAIGVKDGYTIKARASFVGAATRGGHTLLVTMLHAKPYPWHDVARLLDWGFRARGKVRPVGTLVRPGPLSQPQVAGAAAPGATARPVAVTVAAKSSGWTNGLAVPVGALAGAVVVLAALVRARSRRRSYGRRSRLTLPRF